MRTAAITARTWTAHALHRGEYGPDAVAKLCEWLTTSGLEPNLVASVTTVGRRAVLVVEYDRNDEGHKYVEDGGVATKVRRVNIAGFPL